MIKMKEGASAISGLRQVGLVAVLALGAATAAHAQSSMRIAKDPVTGELRSLTAEENAALDAQDAAQKSAQAKRRVRQAGSASAVQLANGATRMELGDESAVYSVMVRNDDGTLSMQCVTGEQNAKSIVTGKTKIAKKGSQHE